MSEISAENYCNRYWALIYDQYNQCRSQKELEFYLSRLSNCKGPVLEVACGTGMILFELLRQGLDAYGFDISSEMLDVLLSKARQAGIDGAEGRISQQDMVNFKYEKRFERIIIPARSYLHLMTQDQQIDCLRNIKNHLDKDGQLILNFFNPNLSIIHSKAWNDAGYSYHPSYDSKGNIDQKVHVYCRQVNDVANQVQTVNWRFEEGEQITDSAMQVRWIYKEEFILLLKLAGFNKWDLIGDFDGSEFTWQSSEMIWMVSA